MKEKNGADKCSLCKRTVHMICGTSAIDTAQEGYGSSIICRLCHRKNEMTANKNHAVQGWEKQAKEVKLLSNMKFQDIEVETSVKVLLPIVDRNKGTGQRIIKSLFSRN